MSAVARQARLRAASAVAGRGLVPESYAASSVHSGLSSVLNDPSSVLSRLSSVPNGPSCVLSVLVPVPLSTPCHHLRLSVLAEPLGRNPDSVRRNHVDEQVRTHRSRRAFPGTHARNALVPGGGCARELADALMSVVAIQARHLFIRCAAPAPTSPSAPFSGSRRLPRGVKARRHHGRAWTRFV